MLDGVRKLLGGKRRDDVGGTSDAAPGEGRTDPESGERLEDLYEEFCATFCFRPDTNLMQYLRDNDHTDLIEWLRWDTNEPEPKALIRLFVASTRQGHKAWEKGGLTFVREGGWDSTGGAPSRATQNALAKLAKIMGLKLNLGYKEKPDGIWMSMTFDP